jgi:Tfp pilus assembly protein PilE
MADGAAADGLQTENGWFTIAADADADSFELTATAIGTQAKDSDCASYSLDFDGARSATTDKCWK